MKLIARQKIPDFFFGLFCLIIGFYLFSFGGAIFNLTFMLIGFLFFCYGLNKLKNSLKK